MGNGEPGAIAGFRNDTGYPGPVFTDPNRSVYSALELHRGLLHMAGVKSLVKGAKALFSGETQKKTQGDAMQQGGILVVGPGGRVEWFYQSKEPGDYPDAKSLLGKL